MKRRLTKSVSIIIATALLVSGVPFMNGTNNVEAKSYGLSNPRVTYFTRETVQFGHYLQEDTNGDGVVNESDEKQPITWQVLEKDSAGNALLFADKVLDGQPYNNQNREVQWATSDIRTWLNDSFLNAAFNDNERELIANSEVVNGVNSVYGTDGGVNTTDKIFLLSLEEVIDTRYFRGDDYDETLVAYPTKYAENKGLKPGLEGTCGYMLRSPGSRWYEGATVLTAATVTDAGSAYSEGGMGVRPAIRINLNTANLTTSTKEVAVEKTTWDTVEFGTYDAMDISWRVLSVNGDDAFLMADKVVAVKPYHNEDTDVTWADCTLRSWLNGETCGDFYADAFTPLQKSEIKETKVVNDDNPYYGTEGGEDTIDKIYLLSLDEIKNTSYGFSAMHMCNSNVRDVYHEYNYYAGLYGLLNEEGAYRWGDSEKNPYYLRSPGWCNTATGVFERVSPGYGTSTGFGLIARSGVRPVLHLDLSKTSAWKKGNPISSEDGYVANNAHVHSWDSGTVTKSATTSSAGILTHTCTTCTKTNIKKLETIPKLKSTKTPSNQSKTKAENIKISEKKATLVKGQKRTLKVTGTNKKVTWTSSNKKVATVSKKGLVTAKKKGSAVIKAKVGKKTLKCTVKVTNVGLNCTKLSLNVGKTKTIKLLNNKKKVTWKSKNKKICTVTSKGKIKAKKAGTTQVIAKVGKKKYTCEVVVKKKKTSGDSGSSTKPNQYKTVCFGQYWQEDTNGDGICDTNDAKQPITWRILSQDSSGNALLLADKILDSKDYHDNYSDVTWETCALRLWLNGTSEGQFLGEAFTEQQRALIKNATVVTADNPATGTSGGNNTTDRVFILSMEELENPSYGFVDNYSEYEINYSRFAIGTGYSGLTDEQSVEYMVRTPSKDYHHMVDVDHWGRIHDGSNGDVPLGVFGYSGLGVRPAIRVNLNDIR